MPPSDPTLSEEVGLGQISDSVVADNLKTIAGASAFYAAQAMRASVAHANRLELIAEANVARATRATIEEDPMEAVAAQKILSGNDLAQQIAQLSASVSNSLAQLAAAIAGMQVQSKTAGNTPPVTP